MIVNRTLVLIKPDAIERNLIGEIIKRFENRGLKVLALKLVKPDEGIISIHYPLGDRQYITTLGHVDVSTFTPDEIEKVYQKNYKIVQNLQNYIKSGKIVKIVLGSEDNAVALVREVVGKSDPAASPKGSIRGDLGNDSFAQADAEGRSCRNLVHASGTPEEAEKEIELWFGEGYA